MAATVTLQYDCAVGIQDPNGAALLARVAAVNISDEWPPLGVTLNMDTTAVVAGKIRRTIVLNCTTATNYYFPSNDLIKAATRNLYAMKLALQVPCSVVAAEPVVA